MRKNQVVCEDCDYFMIGPNKAQSGPCCIYNPPEPRMVNITAGNEVMQQVFSIYPVILEPKKQYCHNGIKLSSISLGTPKENPDFPQAQKIPPPKQSEVPGNENS